MTRVYKKSAGTLLLLLFGCTCLYAQDDNSKQIANIFENMRRAYSSPVQFRVKYVYANENNRDKALDSTEGYMELANQGYYCLMDSTETIQTDSIAILLFHEDKIMYLSKRTGGKAFSGNPLAMLDTLFQKVPGLKISVAPAGTHKNVRFDFPPGLQYRRMDFEIDTVNYFVHRVTYIVRTEALMEDGNTQFDKFVYSEYALVTAQFFDYKNEQGGEGKLATGNYFIKDKDGFKTTEKYKEYKIFMASPNL